MVNALAFSYAWNELPYKSVAFLSQRKLMTAWSLRFCHTESIILDSTKQPITLYVKAETPVLWPPHAKSWLIGKDSDAGRDWGQEEKGTTEDEMARWHHWFNGHESEWTPGVGDGQGGLACCDSWGRKELDTTERLNWTELNTNERHINSGLPFICASLFVNSYLSYISHESSYGLNSIYYI